MAKYWLYALDPNPENGYISYKGDSGNYCATFVKNSEGRYEEVPCEEPIVGKVLRVGSLYARSFSSQDWWQTSIITSIDDVKHDLEEGMVHYFFSTQNSKYHFKRYM